MKLIAKIALGLAAAALLASCAAATDSTNKPAATNTTSTKKLMVDVPKSLTTKASATASIARAAAAAAAPASIGYSVIQSTVDSAKTFMPFLAEYSIMVDAVISQNSLSPSATKVTGTTLTITQAMVDAMKASVDADMLDTTNLPKAGDSMPMPDFVYNTSANTKFTYSFATSDATMGMTMTLYWNTDKSKFGMEMTMSGMTMTVANDSASASTVMKITMTGSTFTMKFKADSAAASTEGVYVGMDVTGTSAMTIVGWADNNGGAVSFTSSGSTFTEEFTGAGAMSYQGYGTTVLYGTGATAAYTAKLGNTDWGTATTLFP